MFHVFSIKLSIEVCLKCPTYGVLTSSHSTSHCRTAQQSTAYQSRKQNNQAPCLNGRYAGMPSIVDPQPPLVKRRTHTHGLNQIEGWVVLFCFLFNDDLGRLTATCVEECSRVVMLASFCVTAGFLDVACASKRL